MRWQRRLESYFSEDQALFLETRTRDGSHFSASFFRRATNQPAIHNRRACVEWKEILLMSAQRFGKLHHRKAGAQALLIRFPGQIQCCQQAEWRDFDPCLRQFLVIDSRYHPRGAAQVLTRAGQLKKCFYVFLFRRLSSHSHIRCIYMYTDFVKSRPQLPKADYCLLYTSPSPRDLSTSRMPSSA